MSRRLPRTSAALLLALSALALGACNADSGNSSAAIDEVTPPEEADLVAETPDGKFDTGYLSTLATELEGTFESELHVDVTAKLAGKTEEEKAAYVQSVLEGGYEVQSLLDDSLSRYVSRMRGCIGAGVKHRKNRTGPTAISRDINFDLAFSASGTLTLGLG